MPRALASFARSKASIERGTLIGVGMDMDIHDAGQLRRANPASSARQNQPPPPSAPVPSPQFVTAFVRSSRCSFILSSGTPSVSHLGAGLSIR